MKLEAHALIAPLAAIAILALILTETREALVLSGAWRKGSAAPRAAMDPFAPLDGTLAAAPPERVSALRDPFGAGAVTEAASAVRPAVPKPARPAPPPAPRLTSIVFDADPRATVRWDGRDYSVRGGSLFADFRVVSISKDRVVLDRGGESIVLVLPQKGE